MKFDWPLRRATGSASLPVNSAETPDVLELDTDQRKLNVFISYSRKDAAFAQRLAAALEKRDLRVRIDERDLPTLEDWRRELLAFIVDADAVVFIISPNSVKSPVCAWEVEQAASMNKRLAPVVLERVEDQAVPEALGKITYLFFDPPHDFEAQTDLLATALQSSIGWIKDHTRLGSIARRWLAREEQSAGSGVDLLVRGQELADAELWLLRRPPTAPQPSNLHRQFIEASRRAEQRRAQAEARRARWRMYGAIAAAIVLAVASTVIFALYVRSSYNFTLALLTKADQLLVEDKPNSARVVAASMTESPLEGWLRRRGLMGSKSDEAVRVDTISAIAHMGSSGPIWSRKYRAAAMTGTIGPDGTTIAVGFASGTVLLSGLDGRKGDRSAWLHGHARGVVSARFSPDGRWLATASTNDILIWDTARKRQVVRLCAPHARLNELAFDPKGDFLAAVANDGVLRVWQTGDWRNIHASRDHDNWSLGLDFDPTGRLLATIGNNGEVVIRSTLDWQRVRVIPTGRIDLVSVAFDPDSRHIATAALTGSVDVWELHSGPEGSRGRQVPIPAERRWKVRYSPDGKLLAVSSWDGTVRFVDARTLEPRGTIDGHDHWVNDSAFSKDSSLLVTSSQSGTVRIWDLRNLHPMFQVIKDDARETLRGRYNSQGTSFVSGGRDGLARSYSVEADGRLRLRCSLQHPSWVFGIAFSPDGKWVASSGTSARIADNAIEIWGAETCAKAKSFVIGRNYVPSLDFSPKEMTIAWVTESGEVRIGRFDGAPSGDLLETVADTIPHSVAFSPDGRKIAVGYGDGTVKQWDIARRAVVAEYRPHRQAVTTLIFHPSGDWIAAGGPEERIVILDAKRNGAEGLLRSLDFRGGSNRMALSGDGGKLVVGSEARYIAIWDTSSWEKIFQLHAHVGVRTVLGVHPRRHDLAFDGELGNIRVLLREPAASQGVLLSGRLEGMDVRFDNYPPDVSEENLDEMDPGSCEAPAELKAQ